MMVTDTTCTAVWILIHQIMKKLQRSMICSRSYIHAVRLVIDIISIAIVQLTLCEGFKGWQISLPSKLKPVICVFQQKQIDMDHGWANQLNNSCTNDQWWWIDYSNTAITAFGQLIQQIFNNLSTIHIYLICGVYLCRLCNIIINNIVKWFTIHYEIIYFPTTDFGDFPTFVGCPYKTIIINYNNYINQCGLYTKFKCV